MRPETDIPPDTKLSAAHARQLFARGVAASTIYVVGLGIYSAFEWQHMLAMKPDEFATFLSGVFAPLAFLWLVLGFRQQGDELQNSARALWLQGEELRNSVEQQRQLVEVSREQLNSELEDRLRSDTEADRAAQPQLLMPRPSGTFMGLERHFDVYVSSGGPTCSNVRMQIDGALAAQATILQEGNHLLARLKYAQPEDVLPITVIVDYIDRRGNARQQAFHVPIDETGGPNRDRSFGEPTAGRSNMQNSRIKCDFASVIV